MKILVVSDSHKGFISSSEAGNLIKEGIRIKQPEWTVNVLPVGDGGEGALESIMSALKGEYRNIQAVNSMNEHIVTKIGLIPFEKTAVLESCDLIGSRQLNSREWNTINTSSFGLGLAIRNVAQMDVYNVLICLGGSIVSDGGAGMAQALGAEYIYKDGRNLSPQTNNCISCADLPNIAQIDVSNIPTNIFKKEYTILADVNIPLLGPKGQANTFGPQKKATTNDILFIENSLSNWNSVLQRTFDKDFNISLAGAAGGVCSGLKAFLGGELCLGIDYILDVLQFDSLCLNYDVIITGEGSLDTTTTLGKCCAGIAKRCKKLNKPYFGIFGRIADLIDDYADKSIDASICDFSDSTNKRLFSKAAIIEAAANACDVIKDLCLRK